MEDPLILERLRNEISELRDIVREHTVVCTEAKRSEAIWKRGIEATLERMDLSTEKMQVRIEKALEKLQESYTAAFNAMTLQAVQIKAGENVDGDLRRLVTTHIAADETWQRKQDSRMWQIMMSALAGTLSIIAYLLWEMIAHALHWI